ncbi:ankyrin repeat-containing domain protein, partial [Baffinella frigidus]
MRFTCHKERPARPLAPLDWKRCKATRTEVVERLLAEGADIQRTDNLGLSPLHLAAWGGHGATLQLLLNKGAHVHARSKNKRTPLHNAAAADGSGDVVQFLLDKGADANAKDGNGEVPICRAATEGNHAAVQILLDNGADPNIVHTTLGGETPIHTAVCQGHLTIVQLLLAKGATINLKAKEGATPL